MNKIRGKLRRSGSLSSLSAKLKKAVDTQIQEQAFLTANDMKTSILSGAKTGRIYNRGGKAHQASAPGEAPAHDTGDLVSKIHTEKTGFAKSDVIAASARAIDLEYGTSKMEARPFARPALEENKIKLSKSLRKILKSSAHKAKK